jgi:hypothetical protein
MGRPQYCGYGSSGTMQAHMPGRRRMMLTLDFTFVSVQANRGRGFEPLGLVPQ